MASRSTTLPSLHTTFFFTSPAFNTSRHFSDPQNFATTLAFINSAQDNCVLIDILHFPAPDITYDDDLRFRVITYLSLLPTSFRTARDGSPRLRRYPAHANTQISNCASFQRTTCNRFFRFSRNPRGCLKCFVQRPSCLCSPLLPPPSPQHDRFINDMGSTRLDSSTSSPRRPIWLK